MSLRPQSIPPVPEQTARGARAAFPQVNLYLKMRDELGAIFTDEDFAALFPKRGQPAEVPSRLALVIIMQYVERLSDRQTTDSVRSRIDWKYALSPELNDPGFDSTALCESRARLVAGSVEQKLLDGPRRYWLFGCRFAGDQQTRLWGGVARSNTLRLQVSGQSSGVWRCGHFQIDWENECAVCQAGFGPENAVYSGGMRSASAIGSAYHRRFRIRS